MTLKKKISIAATSVCVVVAAVLCVLLCREWTTPDIIEAPFEKLYWGMTLEEAEQVLDEAGIEKVMKGSREKIGMHDTGSEVWTLTIEQAQLLGFTGIGNLELSTVKHWPVHLGFDMPSTQGIARLTTVSVVVELPASEAVTSMDKMENIRKEINKEYGQPYDEHQMHWTIGSSDPVASRDPWMGMVYDVAVGAKEMVLQYSGHLYVIKLYGGKYSTVTASYM